jgi:RimJ/RimL family protein N-acetyltransferase
LARASPTASSEIRLAWVWSRSFESDLPAMAPLLAEPEVAVWWGADAIDEIRSHLTSEIVSPFRIVVESATVGYAQVYHANRDEFWPAFGVPRETFGVDLSIGVAVARNRGVGRAVLRLLIDRLFAWPEVVRVQIDPDPTNARAIAANRAAGFVERGIYPGYEGETMLYMTIERGG